MDKLATVAHEQGVTRTPLLRDCLAVYECRVLNRMDGGEMTVFLGEAVHGVVRRAGTLLWRHDLIARMPDDRRAAYEAQRVAAEPLNLQLRNAIQQCNCAPAP